MSNTPLTAVTPHSKSRSEAWVAFEAALLAMQGLLPKRKESLYQKQFWRDFNRLGGWWLYAVDWLPNSGKLQVRTLDGKLVWVDALVNARYHPDRLNLFKRYLVRDEFPDVQARQLSCAKCGMEITLRYILEG